MTEEQCKFFAKQIIDNCYKHLSDRDKEILKQAVDESRTLDEMFAVLVIEKAFR